MTDEMLNDCVSAIETAIEEVDGIRHVSSNAFGEFLLIDSNGERYTFNFVIYPEGENEH